MKFFGLSVLMYAGLTAWLAERLQGTSEEWGYTLAHLLVAAAINTHLLWVARRRQLSFLGSPPLGLLVLNHIYFTVNGLKYFSPILLYPQFELDLRTQFLGSLAGAVVLVLCARLLLAQHGPTTDFMHGWLQRRWPDVRGLMICCVLGSAAAKLALMALGYGSAYTDTEFHEHAVRSYGDYFVLLANETLGGLALLLGLMYLMVPAGWDHRARPAVWVLAAAGVLLQLGYNLFYLKARAVLLVSVVMFALASEVVSRRRAAWVLQCMLILLPALSLLGVQLTLLIGRFNVPEETGLRLAIGAINRRADITDFATALVVRSNGEAYDPGIVTFSVLNAVPRFLFPDKQEVVGDVYSDILQQKLGWPAHTGDQLADYQDSMFSAGVMAFGVPGFVLLPLVLTWVFGATARVLQRWLRGAALGLGLIATTLVAMHIEVEWPAIPLNVRQAISTAVIGVALIWVARTLRHVVAVAAWTPPPAEAVERN